jgi:predicted O-methyltransferase YrrM
MTKPSGAFAPPSPAWIERAHCPLCPGAAQNRFHIVSIPRQEGEALRAWVIREQASRAIEIGLAFGFSALFICEDLLTQEDAAPQHVALGPWQASAYADCGLRNLSRAGVMPLVEFHPQASRQALPRFLEEQRQFHLAFVDGNHRFDAVFVDLYYLGQLVRRGGVIFLDDFQLPTIRKAAEFFVENLSWKVEDVSPLADQHQWAALRTAEREDARDFQYFVDF